MIVEQFQGNYLKLRRWKFALQCWSTAGKFINLLSALQAGNLLEGILTK